MQKSFFLLPLATLALAGCYSTPPAPVVNAGEANIGNTQPMLGSGMSESQSGWQTEVQSLPMPSNMTTQPSYTPTPQPIYPVAQPVSSPQPILPQAPETKPVNNITQPVKKTVTQDFTIPRDEKNAPIYSQIDKGFYNGDSYTVRKGDTMFLIAYIAGKDVKEVARLNNMSEPYQLHIGQKIKLGEPELAQVASVTSPPVTKPTAPEVTYTPAPNGTAVGSDGTMTGPVKATTSVAPQPNQGIIVTAPPKPTVTSAVKWQWPTQGNVIATFSAADGGNKGIDIAGSKGQPVKAAAAGKVVYAGNALQGYGNLIIIKHNDDFLSAYAHNDTINVNEQENVKAGQTIATLGSTGTNSNKLHFEIRYHGKSVDPYRFLPKR